MEIHAAETVLCGGAYGTPELLLRSGIGDPRALERAGTAVRHELAGVGRGLQEHPAIELEFEAGAELAARLADFARRRWLPEEQAILKLASPRCDGPYDLHVYPWIEPDAAAPHTWKCVFPVALVTPRSRGAVEPGGAGGRARIDHRYLSDPSDVAALAHGIAALLEILAHPPLADLLGSPRTVLPQDDAGALEQFIRAAPRALLAPGRELPDGPGPGGGSGRGRACPAARHALDPRRGRVDLPRHPARDHRDADHRRRRAGRRAHGSGGLSRRDAQPDGVSALWSST